MRLRHFFFIAALEMLACLTASASNPLKWKNVVFVGDSFTAGYVPGGPPTRNSYPALTIALIQPIGQYDGVVHNLGLNGARFGPKSQGGTLLEIASRTVDSLIVPGKLNVLVVE